MISYNALMWILELSTPKNINFRGGQFKFTVMLCCGWKTEEPQWHYNINVPLSKITHCVVHSLVLCTCCVHLYPCHYCQTSKIWLTGTRDIKCTPQPSPVSQRWICTYPKYCLTFPVPDYYSPMSPHHRAPRFLSTDGFFVALIPQIRWVLSTC